MSWNWRDGGGVDVTRPGSQLIILAPFSTKVEKRMKIVKVFFYKSYVCTHMYIFLCKYRILLKADVRVRMMETKSPNLSVPSFRMNLNIKHSIIHFLLIVSSSDGGFVLVYPHTANYQS